MKFERVPREQQKERIGGDGSGQPCATGGGARERGRKRNHGRLKGGVLTRRKNDCQAPHLHWAKHWIMPAERGLEGKL